MKFAQFQHEIHLMRRETSYSAVRFYVSWLPSHPKARQTFSSHGMIFASSVVTGSLQASPLHPFSSLHQRFMVEHVKIAVKCSSCALLTLFLDIYYSMERNKSHRKIFHEKNLFFSGISTEVEKRGDNARSIKKFPIRLTDTLTSKTIQFALLEFLIIHKSPRAKI